MESEVSGRCYQHRSCLISQLFVQPARVATMVSSSNLIQVDMVAALVLICRSSYVLEIEASCSVGLSSNKILVSNNSLLLALLTAVL